MKLRALAIAVAAASVPFAAQAEFTVSGDVTVGYSHTSTGEETFGGKGSQVNFDASEKVGSLTYFGHFEVAVADQVVESTIQVDSGSNDSDEIVVGAGELSSSDMYVGVRGAFGEVRAGNTDNACDATDVGGVLADEFLASSAGGCGAGDNNNLTYFKTTGPVTYAVSYSPDFEEGGAVDNEEVFSVGAKGSFGPATVSLGYESDTSDGHNVVFGAETTAGPLSLGIRVSDADRSDDTVWGVSSKYSTGPHTVYAGYGDTGTLEDYSLGYQRAVGSKTSLIAEILSDNDSSTETHYSIGMIHSF